MKIATANSEKTIETPNSVQLNRIKNTYRRVEKHARFIHDSYFREAIQWVVLLKGETGHGGWILSEPRHQRMCHVVWSIPWVALFGRTKWEITKNSSLIRYKNSWTLLSHCLSKCNSPIVFYFPIELVHYCASGVVVSRSNYETETPGSILGWRKIFVTIIDISVGLENIR